MPLTTGMATNYDFVGKRESLHNSIYNVDPTRTPLVSNIVRRKGKAVLEEWQTDDLAAPDGDNARLEGDEASYTTPSPTVRVSNYMQIMSKTAAISDTHEELDKAGRRSEMSYQLLKRGKEMKRDLETILFRPQGGDGGGVTTARRLASLNAWVKTNTDHEGTGADPVWTSGTPGAARTDGAQRALTETIFKNVLQLGYTNGAEFATVMAGPVNKQVISEFSGVVTRNFDISNADPKPTAIIAAADVYVGDFGVVRILPSRWQRERDLWFLDFNMLELLYLRPLRSKEMAKTGDNRKRMMVQELTLKVKNEKGLGGAFDLNG